MWGSNGKGIEAKRSKSDIDVFFDIAGKVYATLVMVSLGGQKRTLTGKIAYLNGSIDTSFNPPLFSSDSIFILHIHELNPYPIVRGGLYITRILFILLSPRIYFSVPRTSHFQFIISESTIQIETNGGCCC